MGVLATASLLASILVTQQSDTARELLASQPPSVAPVALDRSVVRTTKLYTQPHAEVAPFQRVWNPDTNSVYEDPNDWPGGDADDDEGITKDELCGDNGDACPEIPAFNGEDYFDDKPLDCCYTKEQQAIWDKWMALKNRIQRLEGTVRYLRGVKKSVIIKQRLSAKIRGAPGPPGPRGPRGGTGPKGGYGPKGLLGPEGSRGPEGDVGPSGEQGRQGRMRCPKGTPTATMRLRSCSASSCLVQVQHQSEWGSICGRGVGQAAAKLICKEMGFPGVKRVEEAGRGSGRIWLSDLSCVGDEISATMCSHREWGDVGTCNHLNDLGVCCSGNPSHSPVNMPECGAGSYFPHPWNGKACYSDVHAARSYPEARAVCKNWGGSLFSYSSSAELRLAKEILGKQTNFWLALRKRRGNWMYTDGEEDGFTLKMWEPGSPKSTDPDRLCGAQVARNGLNNYIRDESCTLSLPFICKKYEQGKKPKRPLLPGPSTVQHIREDWKSPPKCTFIGNQIELYDRFGFEGSQAKFGIGEFGRLSTDACDNDQLLCEVKPCNAAPKSIKSLKVPGGLKVTLYDKQNFEGTSITFYGPRKIESLQSRGWSERAQSIRVSEAPASTWLLRMYKSRRAMKHLRNPAIMATVGEAEVPWVDLRSTKAFTEAVQGTPGSNLQGIFYGNVKVHQGGVYNFCSKSSDGSRVIVRRHLVVNNDGLHDPQKVCGDITLEPGTHKVKVMWFKKGDNGAFESLKYRGPDTGGAYIYVPGSGGTAGLPKPLERSKWSMKVFKQNMDIDGRPRTRSMEMVGSSNEVRSINLRSYDDFARYVKNFPTKNLAVIFRGRLKIKRNGNYKFCLKSADGSYLYINEKIQINNGGRHGAKEECALVPLDKGQHEVKVLYWRYQGTPSVRLTYSGEDTAESKWGVASGMNDADSGGGTQRQRAPSVWLMREWHMPEGDHDLKTNEDSDKLEWFDFVGQARVAALDFGKAKDLKSYISVKKKNVAWRIYGSHTFKMAGEYTFCLYNYKSARLYMDGNLIVDNSGDHGNQEKCMKVYADAKSYKFKIKWWYATREKGGDSAMRLTYAGPETRGEKWLMDSEDPGTIPIVKPQSGGFMPGKWPKGFCHPPDAECLALGITDNLCGKCTKTATGFKLENTEAGLRYEGKSFDDNNIGKGTTQAKNICILAKFGNKPKEFPDFPTSNCAGRTQGGIKPRSHWYGNCRAGSHTEETCCVNAKLFQPGQDWTKYAVGNSCRGDEDTDAVLGEITCEFGSASMNGPWPIRACYPLDQTCMDLGVKENLCGKCIKTADGFKLVNEEVGLRYSGASFDDNNIGAGSNQAKNICILARYGNKGVVTKQPLKTCAGKSNPASVENQIHWYGNCRPGSVNEKDCCSNAFVVGSNNDWSTYSKGNSCRGDHDLDKTLGEISCSFDDGTYKDGEWPIGNCWPKSEECKKLGVTDNLCGKCEALPNGGFKLSETKQGLRYAGASFDDNNEQVGSYQAMNICILARYGNGGMVDFNPTDKCFGKITAGPPQVHWYGNCAKGDLQQQRCCSNSALLDSRFEWTDFSRGNACKGDNDLDATVGEVNCWFETNLNVRMMRFRFSGWKVTSWQSAGDWSTFFLDRQTVDCGNDPMAMFMLQTGGPNDRYAFKCAEGGLWNPPQSKTTDPQDDGGGQMMFLDRLGVDCGPGRALTKFHLARRPGNKDVYEYSCAEPKGGAGMQCRNAQTRLNDEAGGGKRTMYLDRHFVECHKDEVLQQFQLGREGGKMRYNYKCCFVQDPVSLAKNKK